MRFTVEPRPDAGPNEKALSERLQPGGRIVADAWPFAKREEVAEALMKSLDEIAAGHAKPFTCNDSTRPCFERDDAPDGPTLACYNDNPNCHCRKTGKPQPV